MRSIFGVPVEGWSMKEAIRQIDLGQAKWFVTANPEILLAARRLPSYQHVLRRADARLVDGIGLWLVTGGRTSRVTGVEFAERLLQHAQEKEWRVGLFGGQHGEAKASLPDIIRAYPQLEIHAEEGGLVHQMGDEDQRTQEARERMMHFQPQVLLVAMGHPKQEMWIAQHLSEFSSLRVVVGVGGTFNFWSGRSRRAPHFLRVMGLEWLWRLMTEPVRWRRILDAVFVFPAFVLFDKIKKLG